jgi:hypothetical protein
MYICKRKLRSRNFQHSHNLLFPLRACMALEVPEITIEVMGLDKRNGDNRTNDFTKKLKQNPKLEVIF